MNENSKIWNFCYFGSRIFCIFIKCFFFLAACRRIQRLKQPSRALYEEAAKVALKNATQRHYIEITGRSNSAFTEKKKEKLVMEGSPSE